MDYKKTNIKDGITLHQINTEKFKTNLLAVFLTTELNRTTVTKNAVISSILRRGTKKLQSQDEISKKLEDMYGAEFDCGLDKTGENQVFKFYIETVNDNFLPENNKNMMRESIENILDIVFDPYIENEGFKEEYFNQEKNNIKQLIEGKIDNKSRYALDRCIEEMYKEEKFGLYKYGYVEDLDKFDSKDLYKQYIELISNCKIDIFVSGKIDKDIETIIRKNENIKKLDERNPIFHKIEIKEKQKAVENSVVENMEVTQGKLVLGLDININDESLKYNALLYNSILGGSANSKLFQNVREKANLAYVASSSYSRYMNNIFIKCGIEIDNYEKAVEIIKEQIKDMEKGNFDENDISYSKKGIIAGIKAIDDEQDTQISFCFGQELSNETITIDEYIEKVQNVKKEDIVNIAKNIKVNTIYFLRN